MALFPQVPEDLGESRLSELGILLKSLDEPLLEAIGG